MSQIQITGEAKIRSLNGALTATSGVVDSVPLGAANGVATLGGDGKVPSSQLPSYVDDVVEVPTYADLPVVGESGKIYITLDTNKIYRWTGSTYVEIVDSTAVWGAITGTLSNQIDLQNALNAKVPYIGAIGNVNLGEYGLTTGFLGFDLTPTATPTGVGTMYWDAFYRTASLIDGDGDTTLQIGQEQRALVHNNTGATLTDGQVVYVTGSTGELPSVALASNTTEAASSVTFGVVTESIAHGANGFVTISGMVNGLNTLAFNEGDTLWLGSTAGTFTNVKPTAPANMVLIGYMIKKSGGNGSIFVKIQNGYELEELHDVLITSVANNEGLFWDSATSLWKNKSIATVLGYTPANDSLVVHLAGSETITGNKTFSGVLSTTASSFIGAVMHFSQSAAYFPSSGNTSLLGIANGLKLGFGGANTSSLLFPATTQTFTFPAATGTIALTSDLGGYLPLSGGTLTGKLTINTGGTDNQLQLNGTAPSLRLTNAVTGATINGFIAMAGTAGDYILTSAVGDMCIGNQNSGKIMFGFGSGTANPKMTIDASGNGVFSGTLSATGGTLTGALSGTSATFSGIITGSRNDAGNVSATLANAYLNQGNLLNFQQNNGGSTLNAYIGHGGDNTGNFIIVNNGITPLTLAKSTGAATFSSSVTATKAILGASTATSSVANLEVFGSTQVSTNYGQIRINDSVTTSKTLSIGVDGANNLAFLQSFQDGVAYRPLILNALGGNVGIGTSSPIFSGFAQLTVNGTQGGIAIQASSTGYSRLFFAKDDTSNVEGLIRYYHSDNSMQFFTSATERMRITSGGDLLVGTSSSSYSSSGRGLIVANGSSQSLFGWSVGGASKGYMYHSGTHVYIENSVSGSNLYVNSGGSGGVYLASGGIAWIAASDENLKTDLVPIEDAINKVSSLRSVIGRYKTDEVGIKRPFLIAQDVIKVLPEAVDKNKVTGELGVSYTEVIPLLVAAIKEQQAQIEELKALIAAK